MGIIGSALGALGSTSSSYGQNQGWSYGGTGSSGKAVMEFNREMMREANKFAAEEAQKNRDWQENMSNTAYQRAIKDMKAAGINPILAAQNGGAQTGAGATAHAQMAHGQTDYNSAAENWGMNSAYSYSNFAEALNGLASAIGSLAQSGLPNAEQIIQKLSSGAHSAVKEFNDNVSQTFYGAGRGAGRYDNRSKDGRLYDRYGHGREWK
ncbi:DNA pilot protein [Sigmofec virus UA08Rod_4967]|uniref:DNA pilot protein n=1 Tax=Sigmofec virus UA08Rod_4967 TaxID=2929413 RepID=A0A976N2C7_9VIRU|nr:DNA pilot protein [Sigmofec virus UA08Rod_4967]